MSSLTIVLSNRQSSRPDWRRALLIGLMSWTLSSARPGLAQIPADLEFTLPTTTNAPLQLDFPASANPSWTVVCFLGTECPLARLYAGRLQQLADEYQPRGVRVIGIDSNQQDSMEELSAFATTHALTFPLVRDEANRVADRYGVTRTPEVFLLDRDGLIRYRGRIDDQYTPGVTRTAPTQHDLRRALDELLAGQNVSIPHTDAVGCLLGRVRVAATNSDVTYCQQIARLLQRHCVECHRQGEIGPMALTDYDEVIGWGDMMLEVVREGRMPPWHASAAHGEFVNARRLLDEDRELLRRWVEAGMPYGDAADLPANTPWIDGWQLPQAPDQVVTMSSRAFKLPAQGTVEYQYYVVDPQWTEDQWITAAEVIPGNRRVVHHAIVFIRPPDNQPFRGVSWLAAYVPGQRATVLPAGHARRVPAGSRLVFQMHYTPNGSPQEDCTQLGVIFGREQEVTHEVFTMMGIEQEFEIPPQATDHRVAGEVDELPSNGTLLSIVPHMHLRGKSFQLQAEQDGQSSILLDVPRYDFNWQHAYRLRTPLPLADVDHLRFNVAFDNSPNNPANPDPTQWVTWGDQTYEEMAVAFFDVAVPRAPNAETSSAATTTSANTPPAQTPERPTVSPAVQQFVKNFFAQTDRDHDGLVTLAEAPLVMRRFTFHIFDTNNDERITRDEVETRGVELELP